MRAGMEHQKRQPQRAGKRDFLNERLQGLGAIGDGGPPELMKV